MLPEGMQTIIMPIAYIYTGFAFLLLMVLAFVINAIAFLINGFKSPVPKSDSKAILANMTNKLNQIKVSIYEPEESLESSGI